MPKVHLGQEATWTARERALLLVLVDELNVVRAAVHLPELTREQVQAMILDEERREASQ